MNWSRNLSQTEYFFVGGFLLFYLLYFGRTLWIAYQLKTSARSVALKFLLRSSAFALLIMALLDPSFGDTSRDIKAVGRDIMLVVDLSKSMNAADIQPTRIEKTKFELLRFIDKFPNDRIGLVIFAAEAFVQSPLTFDKNTVVTFVKSLSTNLLPESGTAVYPALTLAFEKLTARGRQDNSSKILVVFTDGEDFGGNNSSLLRAIRSSGISCFVVGVGTESGARIWNGEAYVMDEDGNIVVSRLEKETLEQIAVSTKGQYFEISNRKNGVPELIQTIEELEGTLIDQKKVAVTANKYYYFLVLALILLSLDVIVTVRTLRV